MIASSSGMPLRLYVPMLSVHVSRNRPRPNPNPPPNGGCARTRPPAEEPATAAAAAHPHRKHSRRETTDMVSSFRLGSAQARPHAIRLLGNPPLAPVRQH